jgi:geranylgeranyl transferase type-1 subunit beta
MTYTALCCLRILGDENFERVNRRAVVQALRNLQQADGSFSSTRLRSESDMRFLYCACVISALLRDWSGFDTARSVAFIARSQAYDGGVGLWPGCEGHGGSTYCAVASLSLMGELDTAFPKHKQQQLLKWLINNQGEGYRGRPNKPEDCCYSFWIAAALRLFGAHMLPKEVDVLTDWTQRDSNRTFNLRCQHARYGGFRKDPSAGHPDLLHAYFGVCGLALIADEADAQKGLQQLDVVLGLTKRAAGGEDQHVRLDGTSW